MSASAAEIRLVAEEIALASLYKEREAKSDVLSFWWLGQAGFALRLQDRLFLIDPYLSDSLAKKYADTPFTHERMMSAPRSARDLVGVDAVFCTHAHSDHMDAETLTALALVNPKCLFLVPRAEAAQAVARGIPENRLIGLTDDQSVALFPGIRIKAIASAHEQRSRDERGNDHFLGYVMDAGGPRLYHSGDCVPYDGLMERLRNEAIDVALLPINGRDALRRQGGILGNFTLDEALRLCEGAAIPLLVAHHFGMFAFNTIDRPEAERQIADMKSEVRIHLAQSGVRYDVRRQSPR